MKKPVKPIRRSTKVSRDISYGMSLEELVKIAEEANQSLKNVTIEYSGYYDSVELELTWREWPDSEEEFKKKEEGYAIKLKEYNKFLEETKDVRIQIEKKKKENKIKKLLAEKDKLEKQLEKLKWSDTKSKH